MAEDEISEAGRQARFAQWDKLGLDRVKADLLNGGYGVVGGPPAVRDLAWEWVRIKEAEQSKGAVLRRDPDLIRKLLLKLEDYPSELGDVFVFRGQEPELAVEGYTTDQITYHLEQIRDMRLIDSPGSQPMLGVTFAGLSASGHDLVASMRRSVNSTGTPPIASHKASPPRLRGEVLNQAIRDKVCQQFEQGHLDTAVFEAMKAVEVAVRNAAGLSAADIGTNLMRRAFAVDNGPLTDKSAEQGERQARSDLFAGAIGSYKNPHSHRNVPLDDPDEAAEIIMLANHLLRIVDARAAAGASA